MSRGLAVIYDSHALMQFLMVYCKGDFDTKWDVLCLPKEDGKEEMSQYCEKLGIFDNIFIGKTEYKSISTASKLELFMSMFFAAVVGKQKKICIKTLNSYVGDCSVYDYFITNSENGFVSGMLALLGKEKTVIYMEDGIGDYTIPRKKWKSWYNFTNVMNFQCIIMARMGYFGKGFTYLKTTKDAIRYASVPEELMEKHFKEIRSLQLSSEEVKRLNSLVSIIFPQINSIEINADTAVVFTDLSEGDNYADESYIHGFIAALESMHKDILVKCHPRELTEKYVFSPDVNARFVDRNIPAELLLPRLTTQKCYFMLPNSIIVNMKPYNLKAIILCTEKTFEMAKGHDYGTSEDKIEAFCRRFLDDNFEIVKF